jgi:hypothetical protein
MATKKTYRPEQLAEVLKVSGKQIRAFLRSEYPRPANQKNTSWELSEAQAKRVMAHFKPKPAPKEKAEAAKA